MGGKEERVLVLVIKSTVVFFFVGFFVDDFVFNS